MAGQGASKGPTSRTAAPSTAATVGAREVSTATPDETTPDETATARWTARLWLRAYPQRWRAVYGADLVGTLLDVAGPGARTVPLRDGLSVVRAGWSLRWREHPPLLPWLACKLFERRLPARYRPWVMDDLLGRWYAERSAVLQLLTTAVFLSGYGLVSPGFVQSIRADPSFLLVAWLSPAVVGLLVYRKYVARRIWRRHVSAWVPPELRPRADRATAAQELADYRAGLAAVAAGEPDDRGVSGA